jgi:hypothetical protein
MPGRRAGTGGCRGVGSDWKVIPGIQHLMMYCNGCPPLRVVAVMRGSMMHPTMMHPTRRCPWLVTEWQIVWRAGMGSVDRHRNQTVGNWSTRRDKNSGQCASDEEQELFHTQSPLWIAVSVAAVS